MGYVLMYLVLANKDFFSLPSLLAKGGLMVLTGWLFTKLLLGSRDKLSTVWWGKLTLLASSAFVLILASTSYHFYIAFLLALPSLSPSRLYTGRTMVFGILGVIYFLVVKSFSAVWTSLNMVSLALSSSLGSLVQGGGLGLSASKIHYVALVALGLLLSRAYVRSYAFRRCLLSLSILVVSWVLFMITLLSLPAIRYRATVSFIIGDLFLLALALMLPRLAGPEPELDLTKQFPGRSTLAMIVIVIVLTVLPFLALGFSVDAPKQDVTVMFDLRGYGEWEPLSFDRLGIRNSGMFGSLPIYLETQGYRCRTNSNSETLDEGALRCVW